MRAEAIESALERVIGSKTFSRAVRLRRFLQHVVQEESPATVSGSRNTQ
jgi:hypothetical protein